MENRGLARDGSKGYSAFRFALGGILAAASLAVFVLAGLFLARSRTQHLEEAEANVQNLCLVLGENITDAYSQIALLLTAVRNEAQRQFASGVRDDSRLEAYIERTRAQMPSLEGILVSDAEGILVHGRNVRPASRVSIADRDYFVRLRDDPDAGLVTSEPVLGRVSGKWTIVMAQRLNRPDGSFLGVVAGTISLDYLTRLFSGLDLGPEGVVALAGANLRIYARHAGPRGPVIQPGQVISFPQMQARLRSGDTRGSFQAVSPVDRTSRVYAFLWLKGNPQYVIVGLGIHDVLTHWYHEAQLSAAFVGVFLMLIGGCAWLVHRAWRAQREAVEARVQEEAKFRYIFENALEGIFRVDLDGSIRHLNPAFARMWGYAGPEEMLADVRNMNSLRWVRPGQADAMKETLFGTGRISDFEAEFWRKDGSTVWLLAHAHLVPEAPGKPMICVGTAVDITERKHAEEVREHLILELRKALSDVTTLSGLLPICSSCKKIRDDKGYWNQLEHYISSHSEASFTHGICPDCAKALYPEVFSPGGGKKREPGDASGTAETR